MLPRDAAALTSLDEGAVLEDAILEGIDAPGLDLSRRELCRCELRRFRLEASAWGRAHLEDCVFDDGDLSRMTTAGLLLRGVVFRRCRLMGVDFGGLGRNPEVRFEDCDLRYASFVKVNLRGVAFLRCRALEAIFEDCDLRDADFAGTDLAGASFSRSLLAGADLTAARNVLLDPATCRVKGAHVSLDAAVAIALAAGLRVEGYEE